MWPQRITMQPDGQHVVVAPKVVDAGHHSRRLIRLDGPRCRGAPGAPPAQRPRLVPREDGLGPEDEEIAAHRWVTDRFERVMSEVPAALRGKLKPAQIFHEVLEHRWFMSERAGCSVPFEDAISDYVTSILVAKPDERRLRLNPKRRHRRAAHRAPAGDPGQERGVPLPRRDRRHRGLRPADGRALPASRWPRSCCCSAPGHCVRPGGRRLDHGRRVDRAALAVGPRVARFFLAGMELEERAVRGRQQLRSAGSSLAVAAAAAIHDDDRLYPRHPGCRDRAHLHGARHPAADPARSGWSRHSVRHPVHGGGGMGEFLSIVAISVLLSTKSSFVALLSLIGFGRLPRPRHPPASARRRSCPRHPRCRAPHQLADRAAFHDAAAHHSARTCRHLRALRVLGVFIAGIIVRRFSPPSEESALQVRIEAIGFGFLIPLFFVVSGANLDIVSIVENPWPMLRFFGDAARRGVVQYLLYRRAIPDRRERARFSLLVATGLPIIVAVTSIEVEAGIMIESNAAALVGAGASSVPAFPPLGTWLTRNQPPVAVHATRGYRLKHDAGRDGRVERLHTTSHRMLTRQSQVSPTSRDSPAPSAPTTMTTGPRGLRRHRRSRPRRRA